MSGIFKQSVGIDCSKDSFHASICRINLSQEVSFTTVHRFPNNKTGFNQLIRWASKNTQNDVPSFYVMEATGVYYESLAYHLHKKKSILFSFYHHINF